MVVLRVLGTFEAAVGGVPVPLGGPRQRAVLALLVAARGAVVPVDRLVDDLWHGEPPAKALASLQAYVSNLRRLLEPDRPPRAPARVLVSAPPGYALRLPDDAVDAWRFASLIRAAPNAEDPRPLLDEALSLWRGPAFAEAADEPWAAPEAARLADLRATARELRVAAALRAGDTTDAVAEAARLTADEPLREEGWRLRALALDASGRRADALAVLRESRRVLADELGLDPGPALARLERAILTGATEPPTPTDTARSVGFGGIVGRDVELGALRNAAGEARGGALRVALVSGEAGIGKSALLGELARELAGAGWRVALGRCPEDAGAPPAWAWAEALRQVAADVPAPGDALDPLLSDAPRPGRPDPTARFRLHRAVWAWLGAAARDRPLALLLDDLHWADPATLALLDGAATAPDAPLLLVGAFRADESERLTGTLAALARRSPLRLPLPGLSVEAVAALVAGEGGADDATVAALAERTGGNPFYVRESVRLRNSEGALVALSEVPEGVRDVLRRRLARLPEAAVAVLRLAAVAGGDVRADVLIEAADAGEDAVLDALDAGILAGLLTEPAPGRVAFAHALVRDTMTADLSALRRGRMHARLGAALERIEPTDISSLARHFRAAGTAATADRAVRYAVRAAELAEDRYAHETAVDLLNGALDSLPDDDPAERVALLCRLLRAQTRAGDLTAARATRDRAVALAGDRDDLLVAAFTAWTEPTPWQRRPYGTVDEQSVTTLRRLLTRPADDATRARLLTAYAAELIGTGDASARTAAEEAVTLARRLGDPALRALTLTTLASEIVRPHSGLNAIARELTDLGAEHDLPAVRWFGTFSLARAAALAGDPDTTARHTEEAADLAARYAMPEATTATGTALAALDTAAGRFDAAERRYERVADEMRRQGSLHAGFEFLARASLAVARGTLHELADEADEIFAAIGPLSANMLAAALAAADRPAEARTMLAAAPPIAPDYLFTFFATFRALAVTALNDRDEAEPLYEALLPFHDSAPAGLESMSVALRPVPQTLAELARLLGRPDEAHVRAARAVADRWNAPHWR
ncbi:BTAD domain-containing putative transcriptional regulator [Actinomadura rayongensis]|uniref:AAA family ATPase n=1 Tax=Actinomadura rayongensis TaxID=1429076 RepID=A0A6I4W2W0_9ACTN|nr:BTAD domain-containing putative transcriptional regulator [Actinomadura rayongensis]MXQ62745.1 AAA family ATPase [Actinomadura rayongensis]